MVCLVYRPKSPQLYSLIQYKLKQHILFENLVPGQGSSLQERVSSLSPGHEFPPNCGGGLVQVLDLSCTPPPQVTGQSLQSFHSDQFPSTKDVNWLS